MEKDMSITQKLELINKKDFAKAAFNENIEAFVVYITFFTLKLIIYLARKAQIALFLAKKVIVPVKYSRFADVFLKKSAKILLKRIRIRYWVGKRQTTTPRPIYNLVMIELNTFKTYIKTNLDNEFFTALKLLENILILFARKLNYSFRLYVNYQGLNNLTIKSSIRYPWLVSF